MKVHALGKHIGRHKDFVGVLRRSLVVRVEIRLQNFLHVRAVLRRDFEHLPRVVPVQKLVEHVLCGNAFGKDHDFLAGISLLVQEFAFDVHHECVALLVLLVLCPLVHERADERKVILEVLHIFIGKIFRPVFRISVSLVLFVVGGDFRPDFRKGFFPLAY